MFSRCLNVLYPSASPSKGTGVSNWTRGEECKCSPQTIYSGYCDGYWTDTHICTSKENRSKQISLGECDFENDRKVACQKRKCIEFCFSTIRRALDKQQGELTI